MVSSPTYVRNGPNLAECSRTHQAQQAHLDVMHFNREALVRCMPQTNQRLFRDGLCLIDAIRADHERWHTRPLASIEEFGSAAANWAAGYYKADFGMSPLSDQLKVEGLESYLTGAAASITLNDNNFDLDMENPQARAKALGEFVGTALIDRALMDATYIYDDPRFIMDSLASIGTNLVRLNLIDGAPYSDDSNIVLFIRSARSKFHEHLSPRNIFYSARTDYEIISIVLAKMMLKGNLTQQGSFIANRLVERRESNKLNGGYFGVIFELAYEEHCLLKERLNDRALLFFRGAIESIRAFACDFLSEVTSFTLRGYGSEYKEKFLADSIKRYNELKRQETALASRV